jgi:hypothetical protein
MDPLQGVTPSLGIDDQRIFTVDFKVPDGKENEQWRMGCLHACRDNPHW